MSLCLSPIILLHTTEGDLIQSVRVILYKKTKIHELSLHADVQKVPNFGRLHIWS